MLDNLVLTKEDSEIPELKDINNLLMDTYLYKHNDLTIGYAIIKKQSSNIDNFYIKIYDDYTSNGYGSMLFREVLNLLKEKGYKDLVVHIDSKNNQINNIIGKAESIEVSNINGIKEYIIRLI